MTTLDATPVSSPSELGIDEEALAALVARTQADIDAGILPSCQFALAREGRIAAAVTLGAAARRLALRHLLRDETGGRERHVGPHR